MVDAAPKIFTALVAKDGVVDSTRVESDLTRRAIAALRALGPATTVVRELKDALSDTRLRLGEQVRDVTTAARAIAKANAPVHEGARAGLANVEGLRAGRVKPRAKKPKPA